MSGVPKQETSMITLKVKCQNKEDICFKMKRGTQLQKLMNSYCERQSLENKGIRFLYDGKRVRGDQTANELEMEDGDWIDAMLDQDGGFSNV